MLTNLYSLLVSILLVISSTSCGMYLLKKIGISPQSSLEAGLLAFGIGTGALSGCILSIGLIGGLYGLVIISLLVVGGVLGGREFYCQMSSIIRQGKQIVSCLGRYNICVAILVGLAILNGLAAAAPPIDVDVLNYHLAIPHIYIGQHRILPIPGIYFSYFPLTLQLLFLPCLLLNAAPAAQLLHVVFGFANVLTIMCIARFFYSRKTAVLAGLIFYSLGDVGAETAVARIDLGVSLYALLAFLCIARACRQHASFRWFVLGGIFSGLCAGSKYTGLIVPLLSISITCVLARRDTIKKSLLVGFVALLVACPWYVRNYVWTGNPVFPFFTQYFGNGPFLDEQIQAIQQNNWQYAPISRTLGNFIQVPWLLLVKREWFSSGRIGPLFLTFLPIFLLLRRKRLQRLMPIGLFCGLWFPFWFWTSPLVRFLFAPLGLLCILVAQAMRLTFRQSPAWRVFTTSVVVLWLGFSIIWNIKNHATEISIALGRVSAEIFLDQITEIEVYIYADFQFLNKIAKSGQTLLFGSHGVYVQTPFILASDWAIKERETVKDCDTQHMRTSFMERNITHVMLRDDRVPADSTERALFQCLSTNKNVFFEEVPVYARENVRILELHPL